ncbi:hypothetical protein ACFPVX_19430 [Cohnella faecalis]|uniref:Uncharacterized protein n=1 Tax=Cohnella faecalis TaxID=2315694 RepID=A0A398CPB3_9BACL|nr:hypothetical protein [Cohnella faecalis]RIE04365.1 hypothetical protein D3H35_07165 [Cohnella faecalis]
MGFQAVIRQAAWLALCGAGLSGCLGAKTELPADQAFARSASALSGTDHYGFTGEVAVVGVSGFVAGRSTYKGEVSDHGLLNIKWNGAGASQGELTTANTEKEGSASLHPFQLLKALENGTATISYDEAAASPAAVVFRIRLTDESARQRMADGLKAEMAQLRDSLNESKLGGARKAEAEAVLRDADKTLAAALSTLSAETECVWTADRRTWFPSRLKEETKLSYTWQGKPREERRVSETNFLRNPQSDTIGKD